MVMKRWDDDAKSGNAGPKRTSDSLDVEYTEWLEIENAELAEKLAACRMMLAHANRALEGAEELAEIARRLEAEWYANPRPHLYGSGHVRMVEEP